MKIKREKVITLITEIRLNFGDKNIIKELLEEYEVDLNNKDAKSNLYSILEEKYKGVTNGYLASIYEILTGEEVEVVGNVFELFKCPCCNYMTLDEKYDKELGTGYDICPICKWEDDGTVDINSESSVNKGTISDYRLHMKKNKNIYYRQKWNKR